MKTKKEVRPGILTVYAGCMFAGKTEAIIEKIQELAKSKAKILVLKPEIDFRSGPSQIKSLKGSS